MNVCWEPILRGSTPIRAHLLQCLRSTAATTPTISVPVLPSYHDAASNAVTCPCRSFHSDIRSSIISCLVVLTLYSVKTGDYVWLGDRTLQRMLNVDSDYAAPDGPRSLGGYTQADVRSKLVSTVHHTAAGSDIFHTSPVAEYVGTDPDDCRNAVAIAAIIAALYHKSLMRDILHTVTASIPATPGVHYPVVVVW